MTFVCLFVRLYIVCEATFPAVRVRFGKPAGVGNPDVVGYPDVVANPDVVGNPDIVKHFASIPSRSV